MLWYWQCCLSEIWLLSTSVPAKWWKTCFVRKCGLRGIKSDIRWENIPLCTPPQGVVLYELTINVSFQWRTVGFSRNKAFMLESEEKKKIQVNRCKYIYKNKRLTCVYRFARGEQAPKIFRLWLARKSRFYLRKTMFSLISTKGLQLLVILAERIDVNHWSYTAHEVLHICHFEHMSPYIYIYTPTNSYMMMYVFWGGDDAHWLYLIK